MIDTIDYLLYQDKISMFANELAQAAPPSPLPSILPLAMFLILEFDGIIPPHTQRAR